MTVILLELHGEKNTKVCSNYFLAAQFLMRTGRYQESLETIDKAFELLHILKDEFKDDVHVVSAKFNVSKSNTHFILGNWKESQAAAQAGLDSMDSIMSSDPAIIQAMKNTGRDLHNNKVRCISKLTGKPASQVRKENPLMSASERMQKAMEMQRMMVN